MQTALNLPDAKIPTGAVRYSFNALNYYKMHEFSFGAGSKIGAAWVFAFLCASGSAAAADDARATHPRTSASAITNQATRMKIQITLNGAVLATATLEDNASAKDFAAMLPLDLTLKDYAATEKIADLPRALTTKGSPEGYKPSTGDISFYAPWGNLAIFHKDFTFSSGLIRLGRLDSGIDAMRRAGPLSVRIERVIP